MAGSEGELLSLDNVKYRTTDSGKSPVGIIFIFKDYVEWRDNTSPMRLKIPFREIKGQRVSPPNKPKVQLQICMQNDNQLMKDRDTVKEILQTALVAHRQKVQQLTANSETTTRNSELEAKKKILDSNQQLMELYKHLVGEKLITPQDFWRDYYKGAGETEDRVGMTGAFLSNIAQSDTNGLKLNLNANIIQNIFTTYPMVHRKHLELVPHEMTEQQFWIKFATSHYFHRERDVLPNPEDPFSDCVKDDEAAMNDLVGTGPKRKRLDFAYLSDNNVLPDLNPANDPAPSSSNRSAVLAAAAAAAKGEKSRTTLIRRCNYLSERILATQNAPAASAAKDGETNGHVGMNGNAATAKKANGGGYASLHRFIGDDADDRIESAELADDSVTVAYQPVKIQDELSESTATYDPVAAARYRSIVKDFLDTVSEQNILDPDESWLRAGPSSSRSTDLNGSRTVGINLATDEKLSPFAGDIRVIHDAVAELSKHFHTCFPPNTPELEAKIERMMETIKKYEDSTLLHAEHRFGERLFKQCRDMFEKVQSRYSTYKARAKK